MQRQLSVEEICKKLKPVFGKKIDDIYLKYAMADSREEKDDIAHMLSALYTKNLNDLLDAKVLLSPPKEEAVSGNYPIGMVSYADKQLFPFHLREKDWPRHVCISGMSGSGKTTLALNLITNFIEQDKPFLVFDWKKSFRPLLLAGSDVMAFTVGNDKVSNMFKMNINQPPKGISPKEWINVLCDLLTESFFASFGVHKVLLETLDEAFKAWGIYDGSENYPTWDHIKWCLEEKLEKVKGREAGWIESALRIATVLTFGDFGKVCNHKGDNALSVEELLDKKVVLELNALSTIEKKFFCEFVLMYIYKSKKANQKNVEGRFDHAILVDEAHNIFLKSPTHFAKESVTDMIYREMREYGTSLICLDQHISKLSDTVKGNSACTIAFQQQLPQDIFDISGLMQLREEKEFFSMLPVGSAIVKLSERYNSPFLIEVSKTKLREGFVSDSDVAGRTQALLSVIGLKKGEDKEFKKDLINPKPVKIKESHNELLVLEELKEIAETPVKKPLVSEEIKIEKPIEKLVEPARVEVEPVNVIIEKTTNNPIVGAKIAPKVDLNLTQVQEVLYEYVQEQVKKGESLTDVENLLEEHMVEGNYTLKDIGKVINCALECRFRKYDITENVTTTKEQNLYKVEKQPKINTNLSGYESLDKAQERFLVFLQENSNQDFSTVSLYNQLGLSSRKGNKVKKELMDKGLLIVQELKSEKGWKKIIKLAN